MIFRLILSPLSSKIRDLHQAINEYTILVTNLAKSQVEVAKIASENRETISELVESFNALIQGLQSQSIEENSFGIEFPIKQDTDDDMLN